MGNKPVFDEDGWCYDMSTIPNIGECWIAKIIGTGFSLLNVSCGYAQKYSERYFAWKPLSKPNPPTKIPEEIVTGKEALQALVDGKIIKLDCFCYRFHDGEFMYYDLSNRGQGWQSGRFSDFFSLYEVLDELPGE